MLESSGEGLIRRVDDKCGGSTRTMSHYHELLVDSELERLIHLRERALSDVGAGWSRTQLHFPYKL